MITPEMSQPTKIYKVWLLVILVFLLGGIAGASFDRALFRPAQQTKRGHGERFFNKLQRELSLTSEQSFAVRQIVDEAGAQFRQLGEETRPRYDEIRRQKRERIRALLTLEQQQKFDQITAASDNHRRHEKSDDANN